jgi:hypothetical protein
VDPSPIIVMNNHVGLWHIAKFFCNAKLGRYQGTAGMTAAPIEVEWIESWAR